MGLFSNDKTFSLEPMLTEEQKQAQKLLAQLASTGQIGGLNTGDQYTGSLGNFQASDPENAAIQRIMSLLQSGTPSALGTAESTLTKLADTSFDPSDPSSGYAGFQRQVGRATKDADDVINRESAITGNRFGNRIQKSKTDLAGQQSDILTNKLGDLYNSGQNRALQAAQGLTNVAGVGNQIDMNNMNAASSIGGLQRMLDTAKAQAQYGEWQRARNERLGATSGAAQTLFSKNVPYGKKSYTEAQQSPWGALLNAGLTKVGTSVGSSIGNKFGDFISNFGNKTPSTSLGRGTPISAF